MSVFFFGEIEIGAQYGEDFNYFENLTNVNF